jgi:hypothetical protein
MNFPCCTWNKVIIPWRKPLWIWRDSVVIIYTLLRYATRWLLSIIESRSHRLGVGCSTLTLPRNESEILGEAELATSLLFEKALVGNICRTFEVIWWVGDGGQIRVPFSWVAALRQWRWKSSLRTRAYLANRWSTSGPAQPAP